MDWIDGRQEQHDFLPWLCPLAVLGMKHTFRNSPHAWACSKAHPANTGRKLNTCTHTQTSKRLKLSSKARASSSPKAIPLSSQLPVCRANDRECVRQKKHTPTQSPPKIVARVSANPACCTVKGQRARPARLYSSTLVLYIHNHIHMCCAAA
jgi:hypothetical protein